MPVIAMLLTLLISSQIAFISGVFVSIFASIIFEYKFESFLFLFISNTITTMYISKSSKRSDLIVIGYLIGFFNILMIIGINFFFSDYTLSEIGLHGIFGFCIGIVSSMLSLAILPYFESLFKITTNQTLLELSNLNHPLMKRLLIDAPGTYQHSLMVANLSEAAAEAIKCNTILCRVGSYFHDIGKLKRPSFFSENQFSQENPHNALSPRISKLIILSHVKEGTDLAKKYKLPNIIKNIIQEHHGTSLLSIFYTQELANDSVSKPIDTDFRYTGPKPQSKESGIIMLADSVEAATRSLSKPSINKIESIIEKIFKDKIEDAQLSDCPLSLNEIFIIKSTFLYLFQGMYHKRVDYDSEIKKLESLKNESDSEKNV